MNRSMYNTWIVNKGWSVIPAHYIIDQRGNVVKPHYTNESWVVITNEWSTNVYSIWKDKYNTDQQVIEWNAYWIHIEIVWHFGKHKPTDAQYKRLNILLDQIEARRIKEGIEQPFQIKGHTAFASKTCPGKLFDFSKIHSTDTKSVADLGLRRITQYTPCTGSDINDSESTGWSCDVTASGLPLKNEYAGKMWACPPEYWIGKDGRARETLQIKDNNGNRVDFECVDYGSAITGKHIDLFIGMWLYGDANYNEWTFADLQGYREVRTKPLS